MIVTAVPPAVEPPTGSIAVTVGGGNTTAVIGNLALEMVPFVFSVWPTSGSPGKYCSSTAPGSSTKHSPTPGLPVYSPRTLPAFTGISTSKLLTRPAVSVPKTDSPTTV